MPFVTISEPSRDIQEGDLIVISFSRRQIYIPQLGTSEIENQHNEGEREVSSWELTFCKEQEHCYIAAILFPTLTLVYKKCLHLL